MFVKKIIVLIVVLFMSLLVSKLVFSHEGCLKHKSNVEHKEGTIQEGNKISGKSVYVCPMNCIPNYVSEKPGKCPKCGMNLEKREVEDEKKLYFEETKYVCPCPGTCCKDVPAKDEPGKCPRCGKILKKESKIYSYLCLQKKCEYKSSKPGKCPHHKKDLKKTEVKLYCPMDDTELKSKDGKLYCEKCKMEVKKDEVRIKKVEKKK